jgi:hypothetical protein
LYWPLLALLFGVLVVTVVSLLLFASPLSLL